MRRRLSPEAREILSLAQDWRKAQKITQQVLGERMGDGRGQSTVSEIECGRNDFRFSTIVLYLNAMGLTLKVEVME